MIIHIIIAILIKYLNCVEQQLLLHYCYHCSYVSTPLMIYGFSSILFCFVFHSFFLSAVCENIAQLIWAKVKKKRRPSPIISIVKHIRFRWGQLNVLNANCRKSHNVYASNIDTLYYYSYSRSHASTKLKSLQIAFVTSNGASSVVTKEYFFSRSQPKLLSNK